jgi:hypothetical protein
VRSLGNKRHPHAAPLAIASIVLAAGLIFASPAGAQALGSGACEEYTASLCQSGGASVGDGGSGGGSVGSGGSAPGGPGASAGAGGPLGGGGGSAGGGGVSAVVGAQSGHESARLPLTGYPVTPLIELLAALLVAGFLARIGIAIWDRLHARGAGAGLDG